MGTVVNVKSLANEYNEYHEYNDSNKLSVLMDAYAASARGEKTRANKAAQVLKSIDDCDFDRNIDICILMLTWRAASISHMPWVRSYINTEFCEQHPWNNRKLPKNADPFWFVFEESPAANILRHRIDNCVRVPIRTLVCISKLRKEEGFDTIIKALADGCSWEFILGEVVAPLLPEGWLWDDADDDDDEEGEC